MRPWVKTLTICLLFVFELCRVQQTYAQQDSVTVAIEPDYDKVSGTHRFFFGENYRHLWATPVKMKVFHITTEKGGLEILKKGGGMQTKSLHLRDASGHEWALRTIQKYPARILPEGLRKSIAKDIMQDQISAEHPYGALVVPPLAEALNIPHSNPQVVFVPDDPALGRYRKDFANQVFLFEERDPQDADNTDNTEKAQKKLQDDHDNSVDQKLVLRARLLDFILGDWDRHSDQWRWERTGNNDSIRYKPIPRDRDQVFYSTSGVLPWLVSRHLFMAKLQHYGNRIRSINRWNLNGRNFDHYFLNRLTEDDWREQIAYVQRTLTDAVLADAVKRMPPQIYSQCGTSLTRKLIARRNNLTAQAIRYYRFTSRKVDIPASDKREEIQLHNEDDGKLTVTINKLKKDSTVTGVIYRRTFDPDVTKEVRVYGFDGKDVFHVSGSQPSPITVRMIGGDDEDRFIVDDGINNRDHIYVYDRSDQKNDLPHSSKAKIRTSTDTIVNYFDNHGVKYDYFQPLIFGSYSRDYGVELLSKLVWEKHGFRQEPYASRQSLDITYGFGTSSLKFDYNGQFKNILRHSDVVVNVLSKGPNYTSNFFGVGNGTQYINSGDQKIRYYHNVYDYVSADVSVRRTFGSWLLSYGLGGQYYDADANDNVGKFLNVYNQSHPLEQTYRTQLFAGALASATLDTRDKGVLPHKGVYWSTSVTGMRGLNKISNNYAQVQTELTFYLTPKTDSVFIIANRIGGGITLGNAAYYQQFKLGGNDNLRGFYKWRFTGRNIAYDNIELRLKLTDVDSYLLPGTLGLVGFNDIGRVWVPGEHSHTWHDGYGGGIYFLPGKLIIVEAVVGFSKEGTYPYISAGFRF